MAYDGTDNVASGEETKKDHFDQLLDNTIALAAVPRYHLFDGATFARIHNTLVWVDACEDRIALAGEEMSGFDVRLVFMGLAGSGEARARLYNTTTPGLVGGSTTVFANASPDRKESLRLFLPDGTNLYKLQILTSTEDVNAKIWSASIKIGG